jgi:hypothetical protein
MDINEIFPTFASLFTDENLERFQRRHHKERTFIEGVQKRFHLDMQVMMDQLSKLIPISRMVYEIELARDEYELYVSYLESFVEKLNECGKYEARMNQSGKIRCIEVEVMIRE